MNLQSTPRLASNLSPINSSYLSNPTQTNEEVEDLTAPNLEKESEKSLEQLPSNLAFSSYLTNPTDQNQDEEDDVVIKWNCNRTRLKIKEFLATKEMTQTAFLKAIHVNSNSFRRFMSYKQPYQGAQGGCWRAAYLFLSKREQEQKAKKKKVSKKTSSKKRKKQLEEEEDEEEKEEEDLPKKKKKSRNTKKQDWEDLIEKLNNVPEDEISSLCYDSGEEVRRGLLRVFAEQICTKSQLCKYLGINSNSLARFLRLTGEEEGQANISYREGHRFLDKLRFVQGEEKSSKRLKNEIEYPNGRRLENPRTHRWVFVGN